MELRLQKLLGQRLLSLDGSERELSVSELGKVGPLTVALLFLKENEDPFLEKLIAFHGEMKNGENKGLFPVLLISLNGGGGLQKVKDAPDWYRIHGENSRAIQEHLIRKFKVKSNTSLILLDGKDGEVITYQGVEKFGEDPTGMNFPWRNSPCSEVLRAGNLVGSEGKIVNSNHLDGVIRGLFFGAYWYPPCRNFVHLLAELYGRVNGGKEGSKFELVFVSSDRSVESFERFREKQGKWLAVPFPEEQRRKDLTAYFNIQSIPALVILDKDKDFSVITVDGKSELLDDPEGEEFPWYPKPVEELSDKHSSELNHALCLIYFTAIEESPTLTEKVEEVFAKIAAENQGSSLEEALEPKFFMASDNETAESLRIFMDLDERESYLAAIYRGRFAIGEKGKEIGEEGKVRDFIEKFRSSHPSLQYRYFSSGKFI